jgi:carbonic anhydrase
MNSEPVTYGPTPHPPAGPTPALPTGATSHPSADPQPETPAEALAELCAGNDRFIAGASTHPRQDAGHRATLTDGQRPFAVIFGCSDSRLAAEIIFDQGLGDLFVVRTAGHATAPEVLGSIEYAVDVLRTPLVVVLGHDRCGAVQAAYEVFCGGPRPAGHVRAVIDALLLSVIRATDPAGAAPRDPDAAVARIVNVHIEQTVDLLLTHSPTLAGAVAAGRCAVVGMSYRLAAGRARLVTAPPGMVQPDPVASRSPAAAGIHAPVPAGTSAPVPARGRPARDLPGAGTTDQSSAA